MFDSAGYKLKFIQKEKNRNTEDTHQFTLIYTFFSDKTNYKYVVRAEYYLNDVFAVKFYCKKDKRSDNKYSKIVNRGGVSLILITCASLVPLLLKKYPTVSFAFAGARSVEKYEEPKGNNQRYRIYRNLTETLFGIDRFTHYNYVEVSSYLLLNNINKDNIDEKELEVRKMFCETYQDLDL